MAFLTQAHGCATIKFEVPMAVNKKLIVLLVAVLSISSNAPAMEMHVSNDQLILSGFIDLQAYDKFIRTITPSVRTIVLTDSPGGARISGQRIAYEIRRRGLSTITLGSCVSACANLFLGGVERRLANSSSFLAFHSNYTNRSGEPSAAHMAELAGFYAELNPKLPNSMIQLFLSKKQNGAVFFYKHLTRNCEGTESARPSGCPTIPQTALEMGIITSMGDVEVNQ
jgi:hypothetical protein